MAPTALRCSAFRSRGHARPLAARRLGADRPACTGESRTRTKFACTRRRELGRSPWPFVASSISLRMPSIWSCTRSLTTRSKSWVPLPSRFTITIAATTVAISRNRNISAMKRVNAPRRRRGLGSGRGARAARRAARCDGRAEPARGRRRCRRGQRAASTFVAASCQWEATLVAAVSSIIVTAESRPRAPSRIASPNSAALAYRCSGRARQRAAHRAAQLGRHVRVHQVQRLGRALLLARRQLGQRSGLVRQPPGQQLVQDHAQRVDVGAGGRLLALRPLGREVGGGADDRADLGDAASPRPPSRSRSPPASPRRPGSRSGSPASRPGGSRRAGARTRALRTPARRCPRPGRPAGDRARASAARRSAPRRTP